MSNPGKYSSRSRPGGVKRSKGRSRRSDEEGWTEGRPRGSREDLGKEAKRTKRELGSWGSSSRRERRREEESEGQTRSC